MARVTHHPGAVPAPQPAIMPVVLAVRSGGLLAFWCPWCRRRHYHGAHDTTCGCACLLHDGGAAECTCPRGTGNGHRVAHCTAEGSPFRLTGYIVREVA